jgi:putative MATE family efflux protein
LIGLKDKTLYSQLIKLSLPIMAGNLLQTLYNLADAFFLGKVSKEALSAPSISFSIVFFLIVFGMGFAAAGTTLISQAKGKGDRGKQDFYLGQMTTMLMISGVATTIIGLLLTNFLLRVLQVPQEAYLYTKQYMTIIFMGLPFMYMTFILASSLQGIGDSLTPLYIQIFTVLFNVALDPLLIFGWGPIPAMEVKGAAIATVTARALASFISLYILVKGKRGIQLHFQNLKPQRKAVGLLIKIGLPNSIGQGLTALGFTTLQGIVNSFGTSVIAAFGIGNRIVGMFNMPAMGFSQATAVLVGQSLGAKKKDQAKLVVRYSLYTIFVFITLGMILTFFKGNLFVRFFINDPEVIEHGVTLFRILSPSVIFFALFTVLSGAFRGAGDTKPIMFLNVARLWGLRVPFAYLFSILLAWGPSGIWSAMFLSNIVMFIIGYIMLKSNRWLHKLDPDSI